MKRVTLYLFLPLLLSSCDREFDLFKETNKVNLNFEESEITDGLKLTNGVLKDSVKQGQIRTYHIDISGGSDDNVLTVDRFNASQAVEFYLNDSLVESSHAIARGRNTIGVKGLNAGSSKGSLVIKDVYSREANVPYEFTVFYNLPPTCRVSIMPIKELSPYEVMVDLSASSDGDEKYGGYINEYEYRIGSYYRLSSTKPQIFHILPDSGTYDVRCRVQDNDGVWSDLSVQSITVKAE
jgi:hypothetical protein